MGQLSTWVDRFQGSMVGVVAEQPRTFTLGRKEAVGHLRLRVHDLPNSLVDVVVAIEHEDLSQLQPGAPIYVIGAAAVVYDISNDRAKPRIQITATYLCRAPIY